MKLIYIVLISLYVTQAATLTLPGGGGTILGILAHNFNSIKQNSQIFKAAIPSRNKIFHESVRHFIRSYDSRDSFGDDFCGGNIAKDAEENPRLKDIFKGFKQPRVKKLRTSSSSDTPGQAKIIECLQESLKADLETLEKVGNEFAEIGKTVTEDKAKFEKFDSTLKKHDSEGKISQKIYKCMESIFSPKCKLKLKTKTN